MSGSEPIWAEQDRGGWWSSTAATSTRQALAGGSGPQHPGVFRTRLAVVHAFHNDGSLVRAEEIAGWVASSGGGALAYVERLALDNWGVVVLRPERPDALWVLTDQYLVLDPRRRPQMDALSSDEFRACYEVPPPGAGVGSRREPASSRPGRDGVRECPIFDDGEVA